MAPKRSRAEPDRPSGDAAGVALAVSPSGALHLARAEGEPDPPAEIAARVRAAFDRSVAAGLLHLGSAELASELSPSLAFGREIGKLFFTRLSALPDLEAERRAIQLPPPAEELASLVASAPPMAGAEYLTADALAATWARLVEEAQRELDAFPGPVERYLHERSPLFNLVGRVYFHLAENKRDERAPFAFLATYATRLSKQARVQHAPLGRAIEEYAGDRSKLLALLQPVQRAAERSAFVKRLVDSGEVFHPLAWTPREAHGLLQDIPALEASGVVVRVPDWWRRRGPPRARVSVTVGSKKPGRVGMDALLDFDVRITLDGETISPAEWNALLASTEGLALVKGKWVEVDADRLRQVLDHWKAVEKEAAGGLSFLEGMRLLAGVSADPAGDLDAAETAAWSQVTAGAWLDEVLADLRDPHGGREADPGADLHATLRPYQRDGVAWLALLARLGLGACLADDMGLGKTIQILALLLVLARKGERGPHLLVVPASLLGNWRAEMARFAPSLRAIVAHPSEMSAEELATPDAATRDPSAIVLTTYGTVARTPWLAEQPFGLVVIDEAQAIKNPGAKQTRAVKRLRGRMRVALTGTPVENRLGDLWSIFDFLCPGLLGSADAFRGLAKRMAADDARGYAPLRDLVKPYILRRMKSDKRVVADLPDKTEVRAFCPLTKAQAALYEAAVAELAGRLDSLEGIERRGVVLAYLMRFKQICNHPSQWLGDGAYRPAESGKLARLRELAEPIAARQEKVLVFTQFREMTGPLAGFLADVFGRPGLVLHGETPVKKRPDLVAAFQDEAGPPFFVLSLKAGGTGLNLTAASHVVHFDRWWNPAVEDQATDRAYRIGQKKNVLVHKFVCRGTVEEKIDAMIEDKRGLSAEILSGGGGEVLLTELPSDELLRMVSLDLERALEE